MNERIRELYEQARLHAKTVNADLDPQCWMDEYHKKFAELIVEECCNRLGEETILHDGYGYNQHELYNRLRKHFGVEL
jgi:hypothetical protein